LITFKGEGGLPLDPDEWIDKLNIPEFEPVAEFSITPTGTVDGGRVENAIQEWHTEGCSPGRGNAEFFKLAKLANAGLAEFEVGQILVEQAHFAHTPKDRIKDIPRILRQLRGEGKFGLRRGQQSVV
jgi:hypothetical protein